MSFHETSPHVADDDVDAVRQRVRSVVKDWGGSARELAEVCGTSHVTIGKLLSGRQTLTVRWLSLIAQAVGRELPELMFDSAAPEPMTVLERIRSAKFDDARQKQVVEEQLARDRRRQADEALSGFSTMELTP